MKKEEYYLVSLKWTKINEPYITFWGTNNSGYRYFKNEIGIYNAIKKGYHDSDNTYPVKKEIVDELFRMVEWEGSARFGVLSNHCNLKKLGLQWNHNELVRIKGWGI